MSDRNEKTQTSRRQFIRTGAVATAGLLLTACGVDSLSEAVAPTSTATLTPRPTNTNTPLPPTATATPTEIAQATGSATTDVPAPTAAHTATPEPTPDIAQLFVGGITRAAIQFLDSLDPAQREQATYAFTDSERFRWHWTTPGNFPRNGLPLRDMTDPQKALATTLLEVSLSSMGFEKAINIISPQNDLGNDPQLYYVTVFGTPGADEPWGWRREGHHLSRQFTLMGQHVAMTPLFLGAWPTTTFGRAAGDGPRRRRRAGAGQLDDGQPARASHFSGAPHYSARHPKRGAGQPARSCWRSVHRPDRHAAAACNRNHPRLSAYAAGPSDRSQP